MRKTAIVTGAGTGIGKAVALGLVKAGWNVVFCGRRADILNQAAAEAGDSRAALAVCCDVTCEDEVDRLFARTVAAFGRLDLLFNNAGRGFQTATIDETPVAEWLDVVNVNVTGAFLCARAAFRQMRQQEPMGGRIINNGSISAHVPRPGSVSYTATKHAITGLTKSLSLDGRKFRIAAGQIDIGNALTDMTGRMSKGVPQANGSIAPEPVMDVRHVVDAVVYMAGLPLEANVPFLTVMANDMPYIGRG